jgi:hypothetical protein
MVNVSSPFSSAIEPKGIEQNRNIITKKIVSIFFMLLTTPYMSAARDNLGDIISDRQLEGLLIKLNQA